MLFLLSSVALAITSFLQTTEFVSINSIKPNLPLIFLIVFASVYKSWLHRFTLALIAGIILKFTVVFGLTDLIFLAAVLLGMALLDYLPWRKYINIELAVLISTIIINLTSIVPSRIFLEALANAVLTIIIFAAVEFLYAKEIQTQENRF